MKIELPLKRELNFQGPGPPKTSPKRCQKPEQPSDSVPDLTFEPPSRPLARFGGFLVDLGTRWGGVREVSFRAIFDKNSQIWAQGVQMSPQASKMRPRGLKMTENEPLGPPK